MAGKIPSEFINQLLARTDIVEIVDERVPLKKAGRDFHACCPFHQEKTPSFTVSQDKQFYHCFGCGAHGSAIGFLMDYEHMGFVEAVEVLASRAGLEVPKTAQEGPAPGHDLLYQMLAQSQAFYRLQLREHPTARRAVDYLKGRGLSGDIAQRFGIGYAPPGWDNLLKALGSEGRKLQELIDAGMVTASEGKRYDRFRDRIMFPIRDARGRTVAFGGRVLGEDGPKYLNSPETPVFRKGQELYGLFEARKAVRRLERLLVVEGYMDVVALAQHGIDYVVATLGTATTEAHVERLFRLVPEVIFCFDGDRAGRDAAWKALNNALPLLEDGREARFLFLPEDEDPDSLIRAEGKQAFEQRIGAATPLSDFFFARLSEQLDTSSLDGRAHLSKLALPFLERLPAGVFRRLMLRRLSDRIGVDVPDPSGGGHARPASVRGKAGFESAAGRPRWSAVRMAITLLVQYPGLASLCPQEPDWAKLDEPGITLLTELLELLRTAPTFTTGTIIEHWRDSETGRHLSKLARERLIIPEKGIEEEFRGLLERLSERAQGQELERLLQSARDRALSETEKQRLQRLLHKS